jgi:rhamnosyltransferase
VIPAVIVTFHPDAGWPARLASVRREHARVLVVDNSTSADARNYVATVVAETPGASLLSLPANPGIGAALNLAFSTLSAENHARVVAYDQDSTPAPGFSKAIIATAEAHPNAAVIGANWSDPRRPQDSARFLRPGAPMGLGFNRMRATRDLPKVICVITSGSLFDLKVWRDIGGFSADLFLDLVDTDYCLRARRARYDIVACHTAYLIHHRGEKRPVRLLGCTFYPSHTPLFRLRCLSRNRILLFRRHRLYPPAWVAYELAYASKLVIDALLFEQHTCSRLMAIVRGTWEGVRGRSGPVRPAGK